ncbi:hypothetical protein [Pedobacter frigiditerrae]|uniref:hypothetical protein n=1 Tax=Pedobacter frigiditerrae TaxID=2530452 RepID=UPI0013F14EE3|nr:hypothetical protein [Pedobacter frigiditerrae]
MFAVTTGDTANELPIFNHGEYQSSKIFLIPITQASILMAVRAIPFLLNIGAAFSMINCLVSSPFDIFAVLVDLQI